MVKEHYEGRELGVLVRGGMYLMVMWVSPSKSMRVNTLLFSRARSEIRVMKSHSSFGTALIL